MDVYGYEKSENWLRKKGKLLYDDVTSKPFDGAENLNK